MNNAAFIALANQMALRHQMDSVANNLANANTTAFKSERLLFTEYLADLGGSGATGGEVAFPQDIGVARNWAEGAIQATGNPLDLAIKGDAFFAVSTANGTRYTRDGAFTLNNQGQIVDHNGDQLLDERGNPIVIPANQSQITVTPDGAVSTETGQIARLNLVHFSNPQQLREESAGLFDSHGAQPAPASNIKVLQGSIEGSNVEPITEMTRLIEISRSFQSAQNLIDSENQRQTKTIEALTAQA